VAAGPLYPITAAASGNIAISSPITTNTPATGLGADAYTHLTSPGDATGDGIPDIYGTHHSSGNPDRPGQHKGSPAST
jgi:hypothetical protein